MHRTLENKIQLGREKVTVYVHEYVSIKSRPFPISPQKDARNNTDYLNFYQKWRNYEYADEETDVTAIETRAYI